MSHKPRRPPPDADARRAHIEAHGLIPGSRVVDTAIDGCFDGRRAFATVVGHTPTNMTRIRYEDPEFVALFGVLSSKTTLCNPTRLLAFKEAT